MLSGAIPCGPDQLPIHRKTPVTANITSKATVATIPLIRASDMGRFPLGCSGGADMEGHLQLGQPSLP